MLRAAWLSWERMSEAHVVYLGPLPVGLPHGAFAFSAALAISRLMGKQLPLTYVSSPAQSKVLALCG